MLTDKWTRTLLWLWLLSALLPPMAGRGWSAETFSDSVSDDSRYLHRFLAGDRHPRAKAAFAKSLATWSDEPTVQQILVQPVTSLGSGNFQGSDLIFTIVRPDGGLIPPPNLSDALSVTLYEMAVKFARQWRCIAYAIISDSPVEVEQLQALRATLAGWNPVVPVGGDFDAIRRFNGAKEYVTKMRTLCDALEQSNRRSMLDAYLRSRGFAFCGGTVGSLALFVLDYGLTPQPGSEAHAHLSELVQRLAMLEQETHQQKLAAARAEQQRRADLRQAQYDRQAARMATIITAHQAYWAEYNRYREYHYRVYSVPTTRTYTRTYTVSQ